MPGVVARSCLGCLLVLAAVLPGVRAAAASHELAWALVDEDTPRVTWVGRPVTARLRIRNLGTEAWHPERLDNVSYHWRSAGGEVVQWDGRRTRLPGPVPPGGEVVVEAVVDPLPGAGLRILQWDMVRENVAWFGAPRGGGDSRVAVLVLWRVSAGVAGLVLAVAVAALVLHAGRRPAAAWWWAAATALPPLFVVTAAWVATAGFAELSGLSLWSGELRLYLGGAVLLAVPALLAPGRSRPWVAAAAMALLAVVATADLLYMRWFGSLVPLAAFAAAHQVMRVGESVRSLFAPGFGWALALLLPALLTAVAWPRWRAAEAPPRRLRVLLWLPLVALAAAAAAPAVRAISWSVHDPASSRLLFSQQHRVRQWGLVNLHVLDACLHLRRLGSGGAPSPEERRRVLEFFARRAAAAPAPGPAYGLARGRNLLLIQAESLQEWVVDAQVGGRPVMPGLAAARRGGALYFADVFDQSAQGRSSDGEFATLNSMLPLRTGAVAFLHANDGFLALPEVLRRNGYATLSAHPFERGFWNRAVLHPRYGFERSLFQRELGPGDQIGWGLADGVFFERALAHVETLPRPFLAHLITLGLHHPFDLFPARHKVLDLGELEGTPLGNYLHAMHYLDRSLAGLRAGLERAGLAESTVLALYGDHDSGLAVDEGLLRVAGIPAWDASLPARLRRVPFVVLLPGAPLHGEVRVVGGHVDIAPTLLYLLGVERPRSFLGSALVPGRGGVTALPGGNTVADGRILVSFGARVPDGGGCYAYPSGAPLPRSACAADEAAAAEQLDVAALVIEHDLFREVAVGGGR